MVGVFGGRAVLAIAACLGIERIWHARQRTAQASAARRRVELFSPLAVVLAGALVMMGNMFPRKCELAFAEYASCRTLRVTGVVVGLPAMSGGGGWRGTVEAERVMGDARPAGVRFLVFQEPQEGSGSQPRPGERVEVAGRFYPPRLPANPGEPDMRIAMARRGLAGTIYANGSEGIRSLEQAGHSLLVRLALFLREHSDRVNRLALSSDQARLLTGMMFGEAPEEMREPLERSGTSHLFAASGLHVGLVSLVVLSFLRELRLRGPIVAVLLAACISVYAVACGVRPSVVRAALMSCVGFALEVSGRRRSPRSMLYAVGLMMVAADPFVVFDAGAQLSFAVTFSILHLRSRVERVLHILPTPLAGALAIAVSAQIGATPLVAWRFGRIAPIGIVSNVPCVALAGIAVTIGISAALIGAICLPLAIALNSANAVVLSTLKALVDFFAKVPLGSVRVVGLPPWAALACFLPIMSLGLPSSLRRTIRARRGLLAQVALAIVVAMVWYSAVKVRPLEVVFLSVGQGDAIFLRSPSGRTLLIDAGGVPGDERDPGRETVVPYLARRGITSLDVVAMSHSHHDHISGLVAVIESCRVGALVKPSAPESVMTDLEKSLVRLSEEMSVPVINVAQGGLIDLGDGVQVFILSPSPQMWGRYAADANGLSLIMKAVFRDFSVLLTGDAGADVLYALSGGGFDLNSAVLKVPHHGAKGALTPETLLAVSPRWAVISVGPNGFGHPAPATIGVLEGGGVNVLRTDADGAVMVASDGRHVRISSVRGGLRGSWRADCRRMR